MSTVIYTKTYTVGGVTTSETVTLDTGNTVNEETFKKFVTTCKDIFEEDEEK